MKWKAENPEKVRASNARNAKKNCDRAKKWAKENPERAKARVRSWFAENPERVKALSAKGRIKRDHRKRAALGSFSPQDVKDCLVLQGSRCFYCLAPLYGRKYHVEHMTPLVRGGSNCPDNIVCACADCNLRKHTKTAAEFILGGD